MSPSIRRLFMLLTILTITGCGPKVNLAFRDSKTHEPVDGTLKIEQKIFFADFLNPYRQNRADVVHGRTSPHIELSRNWKLTLIANNGISREWNIHLGDWQPDPQSAAGDLLLHQGDWVLGSPPNDLATELLQKGLLIPGQSVEAKLEIP